MLFIEAETSEGEAGTWGWGVVGSVWEDIFQWELGVIVDGQGHSGGSSLCWKTSFFSASFRIILPWSTSVLHRKWTVFTFAILTTTTWSRSRYPHFTDEVN